MRTQKTAEIIRYERACELISCDALREIYMGDWKGKTREEVQQKQPAAYSAFGKPLTCIVLRTEVSHIMICKEELCRS